MNCVCTQIKKCFIRDSIVNQAEIVNLDSIKCTNDHFNQLFSVGISKVEISNPSLKKFQFHFMLHQWSRLQEEKSVLCSFTNSLPPSILAAVIYVQPNNN